MNDNSFPRSFHAQGQQLPSPQRELALSAIILEIHSNYLQQKAGSQNPLMKNDRTELGDGGPELLDLLFYTIGSQNPHADHLPFSFSIFFLSTSIYDLIHLASQVYYPSCSLPCISILLCLGHFLGSWYLEKRKCLNELCFTVALHQHELLFSFLECCPDSCLWFVLFHRIIFTEQPGLEGI